MSDSDTKPKKREVGPDETTATTSKKSKKMDVAKEQLSTIENDNITLSLDFTETKQIYNNVLLNSKGPAGCLITDNSPSTFILVMVTNDVSHMTKMNKEKESAFTVINYVPIKVLDSIGYHKAPYEKVEGANIKQLVFFDKKGKILPGIANSTLASSVIINNTKCLDWKTWTPHPTGMMKNKWRGLPTDVIGTICPGVPLSNFIFDEQKDNIMHDSETEANLKPFSLAIIGIVVRSNEQCGRGYGISIKTIKHIKDLNAGMAGLYDKKWFYNDTTSINDQTLELLSKSGRSKAYESNLFFVSKLVRGSGNDKISERPIVYIDLQSESAKTHQHKIHMQPNNKVLELEFLCETSIYHNKRFRITVPETLFTLEKTGLSWVQSYYQWCVDCNMADVVIIHNDYQVQKMADGGNYSNIDCCIIPNEIAMFSKERSTMSISTEMQKNLSLPIDTRFQSINITLENKNDFAGVTLAKNTNTNLTYSIIIDKSRARVPKSNDEDDMEQESPGWKNHTSAVCRLYSGMDTARHVWCAYLLVSDENKIVSVLPVGIQANKPAQSTSMLKSPIDVNIYANPDVFLS